MDKSSHIYIPKRLYDKLKCIYNERLTIIAAPDGFGKTTTVSEFVRRSRPEGLRCRTITDNISADDCFAKYCQLVLGKEEHIPVTQAEYVRLCRVFSDTVTDKKTLVIFDSPAAEKMILTNMYCARLLTKYAPTSTVVLCTSISYHHEREMAYYKIKYITSFDFSLTEKETEEYFTRCGIDNADITTIHNETEGEILRTRLCAVMHSQGLPITDYRSDRLIVDAIIQRLSLKTLFAGLCAAAYASLDDSLLKDLAARSEIVDHFGMESICKENILNGIEEINNIVPLIQLNRKTHSHTAHIAVRYGFYRYFMELPQNVRQAMHYCSAQEFLREGKTFRAFCQFYLSGDYYAAATVDKRGEIVSFELLMRNKELLFKFVLECPFECKPIIPKFLRMLSLLMLTTYRERVMHRYDDVIEFISNSPDYTENERRSLLSYAYALRTYQDFYIIEKMGNHIKRAYDLFSGDKSSFPPFYSWPLYTPSVFSTIHRYSVPIKTETEQFIRFHKMYTEMIGHGEHIEELYLTEVLYLTGDFENGLSRSLNTLKKCTGRRYIPTRLIALSTGARCALLTGNYPTYRKLSDEIAVIARKYSTTEIGDMASMCLALLCCMKTGGDEDIWPLCISYDSEVLLNRYTAPFCFFVRCFAMISHKEYRTLLARKDYYLQAAKEVRNETLYIMLQMSAATAHFLLDEKDEAIRIMFYITKMLDGSGVIIPAAELCVHFPQIFEFSKDQLPQKYAPFFDKVISTAKAMRRNVELLRTQELTELSAIERAHSDIAAVTEASMNSLEQTRKKLGLTKQALKYAILAARRHSNEEIAELCSVSVDSVKSSLKRTFAKLGLRSRGQLKHILNLKD